jgi:hypothetical protein
MTALDRLDGGVRRGGEVGVDEVHPRRQLDVEVIGGVDPRRSRPRLRESSTWPPRSRSSLMK